MLGTHQKRLLMDMFENLPGISFLILMRATDDMRLAGWVGTVLAILVGVSYASKVLRPQPILLGINLFMIAITPLIELLVLSGYRGAADVLISNIDTFVLASVFATGLLLTGFTSKGFLTYEAESKRQMRVHSAVLLAICAGGVAWSMVAGQNYLVSLAVPLMLLFGVQQFLRAGTTDRQSQRDVLFAAACPSNATGQTAI